MIAEGSYGCVYKRGPAECIVSGDNVIKVFETDEEERKDWATSKILFRIDPKQNFFAYSISRCLTSYADIRRLNPSGADCSLFASDREKNRQRYVHYMPNAGVTLYRHMHRTQVSFRQSKRLLFEICQCLHRLNRGGYYHNDIKHDNVMVDAKSGKIRLIDFGLMQPKENYLSRKWMPTMTFLKSGFWYPPEYRWYFERLPTRDEKKINELIDVEVSLASTSLIKRYVYDGIKGFVDVYFDALETFSLTDHEKYFDRVDVYSLGQMVASLFLEKVVFENDRQFNFYVQLIRRMIHPDYKKRSSLSQVIKFLE